MRCLIAIYTIYTAYRPIWPHSKSEHVTTGYCDSLDYPITPPCIKSIAVYRNHCIRPHDCSHGLHVVGLSQELGRIALESSTSMLSCFLQLPQFFRELKQTTDRVVYQSRIPARNIFWKSVTMVSGTCERVWTGSKAGSRSSKPPKSFLC